MAAGAEAGLEDRLEGTNQGLAELELLGVPVIFRQSGQCANKAVKNINLLAVDFMNNLTVIDDKIGTRSRASESSCTLRGIL
ncbi:hypothetical protein WJX77_004711 [Trebouxia sp. C0004]